MTGAAKRQVRDAMTAAFGDLPTPKAKDLTVGGYDPQEQKQLRAVLKGQHWRALPRPVLEEHWAAFAATPYPGNTSLCGSAQGDEPAGYAIEFRGHAWQDLHPDFLAAHYAAPSFLSHAGFRYYLPAYLIADLLGHDIGGGPAFHLTHAFADESNDLWAYSQERCAGFSAAERRAIIAYLERQAQQQASPSSC